MERNMRFFHLVRVRRPDGLKWQYRLIGREVPPSHESINKLPGPEFNALLRWLAGARHGAARRAGDGLILAIDHGALAEAWQAGEFAPEPAPEK